MDAPWRIEMLGWLRAVQGDQVVSRFRTQKTGALLAYLAYYRDRSHPREVLIELLWPESTPELGRTSLRKSLSSLRHQLEPPGVPAGGVIVADRDTVQLNNAAVTTDVAAFEAFLHHSAGTSSSAERIQWLTEAEKLYRGELLPGQFDDWVVPERQRLAEAFLLELEQLIAQLEQAGNYPQAIRWARRAVTADPLREEGHHQLIRLLAAAGQPEAARRQYQELERLLAEGMSASPADEIRAFVHALEPRSAARRGSDHLLTPEAAPRPNSVTGEHGGSESLPSSGAVLPSLPTGTVTFLLTDIEGSTALWERAGDDYPAALASHNTLLREQFRRHGGYELKAMGDGFLVAFQGAGDALASAIAGQRALAAHSWPAAEGHPQGVPLRVRMALHSGDVEFHSGDYHGSVLHCAQRVLLAGHGGQILCSEATASLLRRELERGVRLVDLGVYRLRDVVTPERLFQVDYPDARQREFPPLKAEAGHAGSLPLTFTRFFGRETELARLQELLLGEAGTRLVTLTGPGGTGKTSLSLAAAARLRESLQGAIWFVPLQDLSDARLIVDKILDALRLPRRPDVEPMEQATAFLGRQPSLLILDNFEQLVSEGAPLVQSLLAQVKTLTVLVTSRQRLDLPGEREFPVPPLPVPAGGEDSERLLEFPSVRLFVDRAQGVQPDFQVTPATAGVVAGLCARLEGLPLAIELAAGRAGVLTPSQMLTRLEQRFDLLVGRSRGTEARHRSLRATLDWSYQLLSPELRRFFAHLSVFRGGWSLEAAEAICEEPRALEYLEELKECSLVITEAVGEEMRYRLLETLREFGAEQLAIEERSALAQRHLAYYLALTEEAESGLVGSAWHRWVERMEREHDNLRAALDWIVKTGDAAAGFRFAPVLMWYWSAGGHPEEGRQRLAEILALPGASAPTTARAATVFGAGVLAQQQGDLAAAKALYQESLTIHQELGNQGEVAHCRGMLAVMARFQGDYAKSRSLYERNLAAARETGDDYGIATSLYGIGYTVYLEGDLVTAQSLLEEGLGILRDLGAQYHIAWICTHLGEVAGARGDYPAAHAHLEEGLAIWHERSDLCGTAYALHQMGRVALHQGEWTAAGTHFSESLAISQQQEDKHGIAWCLEGLAAVASRQGRGERSSGAGPRAEKVARLLGAAAALRESCRAPIPPVERADLDRVIAAVRSSLGEESFAAAWAQGRAMPLELVIAPALQVVDPSVR